MASQPPPPQTPPPPLPLRSTTTLPSHRINESNVEISRRDTINPALLAITLIIIALMMLTVVFLLSQAINTWIASDPQNSPSALGDGASSPAEVQPDSEITNFESAEANDSTLPPKDNTNASVHPVKDEQVDTTNSDTLPNDSGPEILDEYTSVNQSPPTFWQFNVPITKNLSADGRNPFLIATQEPSVVFVIDKSSSMQGEAFEQVTNSLFNAIKQLDDEKRFLVIFFDKSPHSLQPKTLMKATEQRKQAAREFIQQQTPSGNTEPYEAMRMAIELNPDSIVILSDGDFLITEVRRISQLNKAGPNISIHCIGLKRKIQTLEQLAEDNSGTYTTANTTP